MVSYLVKNGYLIIRDSRRYLLKTKSRGLPVEELVGSVPEALRAEAATALALALFRVKRHETVFERLRAALHEPSKREVVLGLARYYIRVSGLFGRELNTRASIAMRTVLSVLP